MGYLIYNNLIDKTIITIMKLKIFSNELPKQLRILKNEPLLFITIPLAFPILLIIILISPVIHIKIGFLFCDRIGHFALNTELYLLEKKYLKKGFKAFLQIDLFYLPRKKSCNKTLENLWREKLNILPNFILRPFCLLIRSSFILSKGFRCGDTLNGERDICELLDRYPPTINLGKKFLDKGKKELFTHGIPNNAKVVCLISRDNSYLKQMYKVDVKKHDYRNNNINDFLPAAEQLTNYGYYVFRMGSTVNEKLNSNNKMIIDYANNGMRSDFLDIYLGATCKFCITTSLGFDNIPMIFRKPNLYINHAPLFWLRLERSDNIEVPAMYYSRKKDRNLNISEIFEYGISDLLDSEDFKQKQIDIIKQSPEQIKQAAIEMHLRLNKEWVSTVEDKMLQEKFKSIYPNKRILKNKRYHGNINSNIGSFFLRTNQWWLE